MNIKKNENRTNEKKEKEKKSKLDVTIVEVVITLALRAGSSFTLIHITWFEKRFSSPFTVT